MRVNDKIIASIIDPDETFIWEVTGSTADIKYQPLVWLAILLMLGLGFGFLKYAQVAYDFTLTVMNLSVFCGIWFLMMFLIGLIYFIILHFLHTIYLINKNQLCYYQLKTELLYRSNM